jgi:D-alanyl-D-alanine carboxypeptidase
MTRTTLHSALLSTIFSLTTPIVTQADNHPTSSTHSFDSTSIKKKVTEFSEKNNNTGVLLLIKENGTTLSFAAGVSNREKKTPIKTDDLFEIGSASKVFTGVAIFQLIEQGKLSLNTPIKTFYPSGAITGLANFQNKNYWDQITVGMLLKHTSGMIDYLNVYQDDKKALKLLGGRDKTYTFDQLIQLALDHGDANFKPGKQFKYCNTGYILLGDIITKVSGMHWRDYIETKIFTPLGMKHTYFGSRLPSNLRNSMPGGYYNQKPSSMPPTLASSAGEIISTLEDLASFMTAWSHGDLYANPKTLKLQQTDGLLQVNPLYNNLLYGYGITKIGTIYGHGGQTFGFQSFIAADIKTGNIYIIGMNDATANSMDLLNLIAPLRLVKKVKLYPYIHSSSS